MQNSYLSFFFIFISLFYNAQNYEISYQHFSNNKPDLENPKTVTLMSYSVTYIFPEFALEKKNLLPFEFSQINWNKSKKINYYFSKDRQLIANESFLDTSTSAFTLHKDQKKILGYNCQKATTSVNSNSFTIWYTTELGLKGAPSALGLSLGVVLEIERNGNYRTTANTIKKIKKINSDFIPFSKAKNVDYLTYKDIIWKNSFTTISVFNQELIRFSDEAVSDSRVKRFAKGTLILKKVKFPKIKTTDQVFLEIKQKSNGDAYDRTGSVFVIPEDRTINFFQALEKNLDVLPNYTNGNGKQYKGIAITDQYLPLLELTRFFTSFGVGMYNFIQLKDKTWQAENFYRQDISTVYNAISDRELWVGTFIGNYDQGGHQVSVDITIHPSQRAIFPFTFVLPLFNTVNVMEMAGQEYPTLFDQDKGLEVSFELNKDYKNVTLRYTSTGHGGWEKGDEFVPKKNTLFLDGKEIFQFIPWKEDCGSYRLYNPASGNFSDGLSSSDLSRANWCPGTVTTPEYISLGDLKAGKHTIQVKIPQGASEGNSFSSWNVSGVLLAE